jgi:hypothetical protein
MTDGPNDSWRISLSRANFRGSLKALRLGRRIVSDRGRKLYIALVKGDAVFCLNSTDTRWPANYKDTVIDLLLRVTTVSVDTQQITDAMAQLPR